MRLNKMFALFFFLIVTISFVSADLTLDVSLDKQEYSVGENIKFIPRVLEGSQQIEKQVTLTFSDVLEKKTITKQAESNKQDSFLVEDDFPSGLWIVKLECENKSIERTFTIAEKTEVEFSIENGKLIIENTGNTLYTKTIKIYIGNEEQTKTLNLDVGEKKEWTLIAPEGNYNIKVTDGAKTIQRENIQLHGGTGNVIGAIDNDLVGYAGLGSGSDPESLSNKILNSGKLPVVLVFIVAVFGLAIVIWLTNRYIKKSK